MTDDHIARITSLLSRTQRCLDEAKFILNGMKSNRPYDPGPVKVSNYLRGPGPVSPNRDHYTRPNMGIGEVKPSRLRRGRHGSGKRGRR